MKREIYSVKELPPNKTIAIYGSGRAGLYLLEQIRKKRMDINVNHFIDSFTSGEHVSGINQIRIADFIKQKFYVDLIVIASIFSVDIERVLSKFKITSYCIYNPSLNDSKATLHKNLVKMCSYKKSNKFHVIDSLQKCFSGKNIFKILMQPVGSYHVPPSLHSIENQLFQQNNIVGKAAFKQYSKQLFQKIFDDIGLLKPDAVALSVTYANLVDAGKFLEEYFKSCFFPIYLVLTVSKQSWRGIHVPESRWAFVYIPKCGSTSFLYTLREAYECGFKADSKINPHEAPSHSSILKYYPYPETNRSHHHFFSIVRNPYYRLASLYHSCKDNGSYSLMECLRQEQGKAGISFRKFCDFVYACPDSIAEGHFRSQYSYLTNSDGNFFMDTFFKLEEISQDISPIEKMLSQKLCLYHLGKSTGKKVDYMNYYQDKPMKKQIFERYRKDFEVFGYDPDL